MIGKLMQTGHMCVIGIRIAHVTKWMELLTTENFWAQRFH